MLVLNLDLLKKYHIQDDIGRHTPLFGVMARLFPDHFQMNKEKWTVKDVKWKVLDAVFNNTKYINCDFSHWDGVILWWDNCEFVNCIIPENTSKWDLKTSRIIYFGMEW